MNKKKTPNSQQRQTDNISEKRKIIKKEIAKIYSGQKAEYKSSKYKMLKTFLEYSFITVGAFIMAAGISLILLPNELSTGGFSGIASIFYYFFDLQVGTTIVILNTPLLILLYFKVGKRTLIRNLYGIAALSLFVNILEGTTIITDDKVLACVYGGILSGIGTAFVLKGNGSTGGSDLVAYIIKMYKPGLRISKAILAFDVIVVFLNVVFFKKTDVGLYSAIAIYLMGKMIDIIFEGTNFAKALFIISPKYKEIAKQIGENVNRGSTGIAAKGMYTNSDKMMILCVGSRNEAYKIQSIAKSIDKGAFIVIMNAREVIGKGFK